MHAIIEQSQGKQIVMDACPSMREIKAALGITGRRIIKTAAFANETEYRLVGTTYTFSIILVN